jgi:hypothetical protein
MTNLERLPSAAGAIESIPLFHRSYEQVTAYSAELARTLRGKLDPSIFGER